MGQGWTAAGRDIDPSSVEVARRNVPDATKAAGDARRLDAPDHSVDACVTNLPFGRQFDVPGGMYDWLRMVLAEMARLTRPGRRVVLLAPRMPRAVVPSALQLTARYPVRLLGTKTTIWAFDRG